MALVWTKSRYTFCLVIFFLLDYVLVPGPTEFRANLVPKLMQVRPRVGAEM